MRLIFRLFLEGMTPHSIAAELAGRSKGGTRYSGVSIFSNKIRCADCGGWFGSKAWHSTDQYRKVIYRCNRKYNGEKCGIPHVTEDEMSVLVEMTQSIVAENARIAQSQDEYQKRYDGLVQRYETAKARYGKVTAAISSREAQSERLVDFIRMLKSQDDTIAEFDERLWGCMVDFVTVGRKKEITVTFQDGTRIQV